MLNRKVLEEHDITIEGIVIHVVKAQVKNTNLRISRDGSVRLSFPAHGSLDLALTYAQSMLPWIKKQRTRLAQHINDEPELYTNGTVSYLWGKPHTISHVIEAGRKRPSIELIGSRIVMHLPKGYEGSSGVSARKKLIERLWKQELEQALPLIASRYEAVCNKHASTWKTRLMTSRWGSCNTKTASITISTVLVQYPQCCLEQVVVHELCHLYEHGHNERFYSYMDCFYPSWREARNILKKAPGAN